MDYDVYCLARDNGPGQQPGLVVAVVPGGADDPSRKKDENDPVSIWALQGPFKHRQDDFALPIKAPDPMKPLLRRRS